MADQPQPITPAPRPTVLPPNLPIARPATGVPASVPSTIIPSVVVPPRPTTPPPAPRNIPAPMAPQPPRPAPVPPTVPAKPAQSSPYTSELRTMAADIGSISTGQAPSTIKPVVPGAPMPSSVPPVSSSSVAGPTIIVVPPPSSSGGGLMRKLIYAVLALAIIGALIWLASLLFGGSSTTVTPSPSPSDSPSPSLSTNPAVKSLSTYFRQVGTALELKTDGNATADFANALSTSQPAQKQALRIPLSGSPADTLATFLGATISGTGFSGLSSSLGTDWAALSFGQSEAFDGTGQFVTNNSIAPRLVLISEASDASATNQTMQAWQDASFVNDGKDLFHIDQTKSIIPTFSTGTYRQIQIHYRNFPYADMSIEWAVVTGSNNKNYLIIAGSRESIFFAIDQLMQ